MDDMQAYYERAAIRSLQGGLGRDETTGRRRRPAATRRRPGRRTGLVDRPVRILVGHAWIAGPRISSRWRARGQCPARSPVRACRRRSCWKCLHILEGEVNLREETRVVEQAKAAVTQEYVRQPGRKDSPRRRTPCAPHREGDRSNPRVARCRDGVRPGNGFVEQGCRSHGRDERDSRSARDGTAGHRRRDGSDRVAASIAADQSARRGRRRLQPRRRRRRHHLRLRAGVAGHRRQREGIAHPSAPPVRRWANRAARCPRSSRAGLDEYFHRLEQPDGK